MSLVECPTNNSVETREKLARTGYYLVRYLRYRIDRYKLGTKDFIRWHKISQTLERLEQNLIAVFRWLWLGNWLKRLFNLSAVLKQNSSPAFRGLLGLYSLVSFCDEIIEDYNSVQLARVASADKSREMIEASSETNNEDWRTPRTSSPKSQGGAGRSCGDPEVDLWGVNRGVTNPVFDKVNAVTSLGSTVLRILLCLANCKSENRMLFKAVSLGQISVDFYLLLLNFIKTFRVQSVLIANLQSFGLTPPVSIGAKAHVTPQVLLLAAGGSMMGVLKAVKF